MAVTDPVPVRVDAAGKAGLLALVDHAEGQGWSVQSVCDVLKISRRRVERWQQRRRDLTNGEQQRCEAVVGVGVDPARRSPLRGSSR